MTADQVLAEMAQARALAAPSIWFEPGPLVIAEAQAKEPGLKDMGATLVAGFIENGAISFVSIGDSLILRYRDGELHRVNEDHSYMEIADREALGSGDPALWRDVMTRKGRDSITIAVLGRALEDFGHSPQFASRKILPGDVLIFASDGLETLSWVQIQNFVRALLPQGVGAVADGLIKAVAGIGGNRSYQDNATLIVVQADGAQPSRTVASAQSEPVKVVATTKIDAGTAANTAVPSGGDTPSSGGHIGKILAGVLLAVAGAAAILFATGNGDFLRNSMSKFTPSVSERGLQPRPALTPDADSPLPQRAPKAASPSPGG